MKLLSWQRKTIFCLLQSRQTMQTRKILRMCHYWIFILKCLRLFFHNSLASVCVCVWVCGCVWVCVCVWVGVCVCVCVCVDVHRFRINDRSMVCLYLFVSESYLCSVCFIREGRGSFVVHDVRQRNERPYSSTLQVGSPLTPPVLTYCS